MPTAARLLIDQLIALGVRHVFTVPGESFIALLDAMHGLTALVPITCRNESGAAMMAEATGKLNGALSGAPGVALVTRGPGAANAVAGIYVAQQDATAMVLFVGLPSTRMANLPAFQSVDLVGLFGSLAKEVSVAKTAQDVPAMTARALQLAQSGRPGPVVVGLPEDLLGLELSETAQTTTDPLSERKEQYKSIAELSDALTNAKRPLIIAGGPGWSVATSDSVARVARYFNCPVATSFRRQDAIDNNHRCYVGHAGLGMDNRLAEMIGDADLIIDWGGGVRDVSTRGFSLIRSDRQQQRFIRIAACDGHDRDYPPADISIDAEPHGVAVTLLAGLPADPASAHDDWRNKAHDAYQDWTRVRSPSQNALNKLRLEDVVAVLNEELPNGAIITNGAGNYAAFVHRYFKYRCWPSQLAPTSGSMGYGLPAAIAAKLAMPERTVIAFAGDGCFQMTGQELATAVQYGLAIIIVVANNRCLGTIRMHQEKTYPGRVVATDLVNPDFAAFAKSYGANGETVDNIANFRSALDRAKHSSGPYVIELDLSAATPVWIPLR